MNLFLKFVCILVSVNVFQTAAQSPTTQNIVNYHIRLPAVDNQFPYMAYIYTDFEDIGTLYLCGGVIVNENRILTSASCFVNSPTDEVLVSDIRITAGSNSQPNSTHLYRIINYATMSSYSSADYKNDLIMLQVSPDFVFSSQLSPVAVSDSWIDVSSECDLPTWFDGTDWDYLYWNAISQFECSKADSLLYCAGDPTQQSSVSSPADVGSPMVCNNKLIGLVTMNKQSQYLTNITYHHNWIYEHLGLVTTAAPTTTATVVPTTAATVVPTTATTAEPSTVATAEPSTGTTVAPTTAATAQPRTSTTVAPTTAATAEPTTGGTVVPTTVATAEPTTGGTVVPTTVATAEPSTGTSAVPSTVVTAAPTTFAPAEPTTSATTLASTAATAEPTSGGTIVPTTAATAQARTSTTVAPTTAATAEPITGGTVVPTTVATAEPTTGGTVVPTTVATAEPSTGTSAVPSTVVTAAPTTSAPAEPTTSATTLASTAATGEPTSGGTIVPTTAATMEPTTAATAEPSTGATEISAITSLPLTPTTESHSSAGISVLTNYYILISAICIVITNTIVFTKTI